jgi:hypothetical protein
MNSSLHATLLERAQSDPDVVVRSQLAASCQRWEAKVALPILERLTHHGEDVSDSHIPLLLWWAFERQLRTDRDAAVALVVKLEAERQPLAREALLERTAMVLASHATPGDFGACARLLTAAPGDAENHAIVAGMDKGLEGRRLDAVPSPLELPLDRLAERLPVDVSLVRLGVRLGSRASGRAAVEQIADPRVSEAERIALMEVVGQVGVPAALEALLERVARDRSTAVQAAAINALGSFGQSDVASRLLALYPKLSASPRERILSLLSSRRVWAAPLVAAVETGQVPPKELKTQQVLQLVHVSEPALLARLEKVWGRFPGPG